MHLTCQLRLISDIFRSKCIHPLPNSKYQGKDQLQPRQLHLHLPALLPLVLDILSNHLLIKPHCAHAVVPSPKVPSYIVFLYMLIPPKYLDRKFPFQKPNRIGNTELRRNH